MSWLLKVLLPLAVVLPLGGFVAGSLASTADDEPPAREPIVLESPTHRPSPTLTPGTGAGEDDGDDRDDDEDDDDVEVVTPQPSEDEDDDDRDDRDDRDDGDDGGDD